MVETQAPNSENMQMLVQNML